MSPVNRFRAQYELLGCLFDADKQMYMCDRETDLERRSNLIAG